MQIPTILSGPIIRRVEPTNVYIWIVTSEKFTIDASLYKIIEQDADLPFDYEPISTSTEAITIHAGENIYVNLLKIIPKVNLFPTDTLIGYNIFLSSKERHFDLNSFDLLSPENPQSIVYGKLAYPTFFIQKNNPSNMLYGSCQKPQGEGKSTLVNADLTIQADYLELRNRPSSLFLMGDQIYADDVSDPLFHILLNWNNRLMGANQFNLSKIDDRLTTNPFKSAIDKIHGRQFIMEHFCKFTSENAANHLMRFGEYSVMYLLTLGPQLWEGKIDKSIFPSFEQLMTENQFYFMYPDEAPYHRQRAEEYENHAFRYENEIKKLIPFLHSLANVRRVLANTPTYMIFDDHDITDDWNISSEWVDGVMCQPLGKQVIANGLAAYWFFQGWGNAPDNFNHHFFARINSLQNQKRTEQLLQSHSWHFVAPTTPKTLFLDTRTMREYDEIPEPIRFGNIIEEALDAPQLIGRKGWELTAEVLEKSSWENGDSLIIISPTPLYGIGIIESFLQHYVYPLRILGFPMDYSFDFEAWKYNGKGFNRFLQQLAKWNPTQCYILSGDVHYAGAIQSEIKFNNKFRITINQFTSSPIHNMSFSGIWGLIMKGTIWFNALKRKKRVIRRSCDQQDNLVRHSNKLKTKQHKWQEEIAYLTSSDGSIIETKNNIGLLSVDSLSATNKLIQSTDQGTKVISYSPITIKNIQSK
ncbi:hypothetical protein [Virgibacillus sp. DJP39]|uniref:hypothetical protein n=1 Tax=Virgibacillus sp. DJP39 TaxID=3409790 RepID=UPI003BB5D031